MKESFLERVIELAVRNVRDGTGGPFAALVVRDGEIVAEGANQVTSANDPTAHAEVIAIRAACKALGHFQLDGCEIYASCEPCPMCLGAIYWARPARVYFAATAEDAARAGFDDSYIYRQVAAPRSERAIPTIGVPSPRSGAPFEEWNRRASKTMY